MCLLPGLSFGENPRIAELTRSKQEKMERLQKCEGTTKALKIAGLSTIGLTAVGVVGNVVESQKLQTYQGQSNALDTQIAQTKKEIEDKKAEIKTNKAEPTEPTNPAETSTTTTTPTTTGLAAVDTSENGNSARAYNKDGSCDRYANGGWENDSTNPSQTCSGLKKEQWEVEFSYGRVSGNSKCSSTKGTHAEAGNPEPSEGQYCWCKVKYYTPSGGEVQDVESLSSWVFIEDENVSVDDCAYNCTQGCANSGLWYSEFRAPVFAGDDN